MTPERKLDLLLGAAEPRTPDYVFMADVSRKLARRRAWAAVGQGAPWAVVAALTLWGLSAGLGPSAEPVLTMLGEGAGPLGAAAGTAALALLLVRRFSPR